MASRILIAEQDNGTRAQIASWLEGAGFACSSIEPGNALGAARTHQPDVAVVGVSVPDDGGMWIVRSLRSQPTPPGVVVMSSTPNFEVATAAQRLGAADCLPWPSSPKTIVEAVQRAAEWRSALTAAYGRDNRLREEVDHGRDQLKATMKNVEPGVAQSMLLAILESRSPDTYDHSHRVARSSAALARSLKLAPVEIRDVRAAALLHDIGKIAIPPRLVAHAGPLTDDEIDALKRHVSIGAEVVAGIETLAAVAPIVGATHERYDGQGYPKGLKTEGIPLGARIVAVADAYDTLTARHPYNDPLSHDDANLELVRSSGIQLDPDVVRAWMEMVESRTCS